MDSVDNRRAGFKAASVETFAPAINLEDFTSCF